MQSVAVNQSPTRATSPADAPFPFTELPAFTDREFGARIHKATAHRWRMRGVRGVTLSTFLIGGRRFVKPSDVRAFMTAINAA